MKPPIRSAIVATLAALACAPAVHAQLTVEFVATTAAHESAARAYRAIWEQDGPRIVAALEARTCMRFPETAVAALIGDDTSNSGGPEYPMGLRGSYELDVKRATLVHELGHRHLWQLANRLDDVDGHRTLYLILDRVWADVWGDKFAAERIQTESTWTAEYDYASAWAWARALTVDQRGVLWNRLLTLNEKAYCYAVYTEPKTAVKQPQTTALTP
jgi:hypothetical protein